MTGLKTVSEEIGVTRVLVINNVGQGYIKNSELPKNIIHLEGINAEGDLEKDEECNFDKIAGAENMVKIVRKQSTPLFCNVEATGFSGIEQTYDMKVIVGDENFPDNNDNGYEYEFRKTINVQIEPQ